uniref:Uncharacterized protein LOC100179634 n=1 Tax=Phallusia mammillata TaxID=59560 RepID=A0A6F9DHY3_9ASCI|nr:uncharacterized protein LOC100179634 [Phallusia mammillata]
MIIATSNELPALTTPPSVEGTWNNWGEYSACNKPCGKGMKMRIRTCTTFRCSTGKPFNRARCNGRCTAVWSQYGPWSGCFCKQGKQFRVRRCIGGTISKGKCSGQIFKAKICPCSSGSIGTWGPWGRYSSCNQICGDGQKIRVRQCLSDKCPNRRPFQLRKCTNGACPPAIKWSLHSLWSGCHCSKGRRYRVRQCNGGFKNEGWCLGEPWESEECVCSLAQDAKN